MHVGVSNSEVSIPGYYLFREDRLDSLNGRGGGVMLYFKDSFSFVDRTADLACGFKNCIICEVSVNDEHSLGTSSIIIGVFYRSPNSPDDNNLRLFDRFRKLSSKRVVLFGDFNFPDIDWHLLTSGSHGRDFLELVAD